MAHAPVSGHCARQMIWMHQLHVTNQTSGFLTAQCYRWRDDS